jgi:hypothetical protein
MRLLIFYLTFFATQLASAESIFISKFNVSKSNRFFVAEKNLNGLTIYEYEQTYGKLQRLISRKEVGEYEWKNVREKLALFSAELNNWDLGFETFVPAWASHLPTQLWPTKNRWDDPNKNWESEYGKFVSAIPLNFFLDLGLKIDCADVVYGLRWIFARIHFLPMQFTMSGGRKMSNTQFPREWITLHEPNRLEGDWRKDKVFMRSLRFMMDMTYTSTMHLDSDLLLPTADNIQPGVINYLGFHSQLIRSVDTSGTDVPVSVIETSVPQILKPLTHYFIFTPQNFRQFKPNGIKPQHKVASPHLDRVERLDFDQMFGNYTEMVSWIIDKSILKANVKIIQAKFTKTLQTMVDERAAAVNAAMSTCYASPISCAFGTINYENLSTPSRDLRISQILDSMNYFLSWIDHLIDFSSPEIYVKQNGESFKLDFQIFKTAYESEILSPHPLDPPLLRWGGALVNLELNYDNELKQLKQVLQTYEKFLRGNEKDNAKERYTYRSLKLAEKKLVSWWINSCLQENHPSGLYHACYQVMNQGNFLSAPAVSYLQHSQLIKTNKNSQSQNFGTIVPSKTSVLETDNYLVLGGAHVYDLNGQSYNFILPYLQSKYPEFDDEDEWKNYLNYRSHFLKSQQLLMYYDHENRMPPILLDLSNKLYSQVIFIDDLLPRGLDWHVLGSKLVGVNQQAKWVGLYEWKKLDEGWALELVNEWNHTKFYFLSTNSDEDITNGLGVFMQEQRIIGHLTDSGFYYPTSREVLMDADDLNLGGLSIDQKGTFYYALFNNDQTILAQFRILSNSEDSSLDFIDLRTLNHLEPGSFTDFISPHFALFADKLINLKLQKIVLENINAVNMDDSAQAKLFQSAEDDSRLYYLKQGILGPFRFPFLPVPLNANFSFLANTVFMFYQNVQSAEESVIAVNLEGKRITPWPGVSSLQMTGGNTFNSSYSKRGFHPNFKYQDQLQIIDKLKNPSGHGYFTQTFHVLGKFNQQNKFDYWNLDIFDDYCTNDRILHHKIALKNFQLRPLCGELFILEKI